MLKLLSKLELSPSKPGLAPRTILVKMDPLEETTGFRRFKNNLNKLLVS